MSIPKLRTSTAIEKALGITAVATELKTGVKDYGGNQAQMDKPGQAPLPEMELTADRMSTALQGISANSCDEIDALIGDLRGLREKLVTDCNRIEEGIAEFTRFSQSVMRLTEVVTDGIAHVRMPGAAE